MQITIPATITLDVSELVKILKNIPQNQPKPDVKPQLKDGEWLTMVQFKAKYNMSEPSVRRRVYNGIVDVQDFGGTLKRYRMTTTP